MIVQDMHNPGELSLHQSVRRMSLIASSMQTDAIHAQASSDSDPAMYASSRDDEVDRLYLVIKKQLRIMLRKGQVIDSQKGMTPDMSPDPSLAARPVESIADHTRKIALITTSLNIVSDIIDRIGEYGANIANIAKNSDKFNYIKISVSKKYE